MSEFMRVAILGIVSITVISAIASCSQQARNRSIAECVRAGSQPQACREAMK